jgi:hypothetical protein
MGWQKRVKIDNLCLPKLVNNGHEVHQASDRLDRSAAEQRHFHHGLLWLDELGDLLCRDLVCHPSFSFPAMLFSSEDGTEGGPTNLGSAGERLTDDLLRCGSVSEMGKDDSSIGSPRSRRVAATPPLNGST